MAHIVWIGDGKVKKAKVVYEVKSKGGRKRKSTTFPVGTPIREIQAYKRKMEDLYEKAEGVFYCKKTVTEMVELFMEIYGPNLSPSTYRSYSSSFYAKPYGIVAFLGDMEFQKVKLRHVQEYCNALVSAEKSLSTIENRVLLIHTLYEKLKRLGYLERDAINPAEDVEFPRKKSQKKEPYDFDEIHTMLKLIDEYGNAFLKLQVWLGLYCGLRRSEMASLQFNDIDFANKLIHINKALVRGIDGDYLKETKTEAGNRELPIPSDLLALLKKRKIEYQECRMRKGKDFEDSGYLFSDECGCPFGVSSISHRWQRFQKFAEKRGLRKLPFHYLRHAYATLLLAANVDIKTAQGLLGHSSIQMTADIYASSLMSKKREAVESLDNLLKAHA